MLLPPLLHGEQTKIQGVKPGCPGDTANLDPEVFGSSPGSATHFPGDLRHTAFPPGAVTAPSGAVAWRHVGKRFENQSREQLAPPLWKSPAAPQKAKQSVTVGPS